MPHHPSTPPGGAPLDAIGWDGLDSVSLKRPRNFAGDARHVILELSDTEDENDEEEEEQGDVESEDEDEFLAAAQNIDQAGKRQRIVIDE